MASLIPTLLALGGGALLGYLGGGHVTNVAMWQPALWQVGATGFVLQLLPRVISLSGGFAVLIEIISLGCLLAFAVANLRVGGMIVIAVGLGLLLIPVLINGGRPVNATALVNAGLAESVEQLTEGDVELQGPRHLADDDSLKFLGDVIPLSVTSQVISIGDLFLWIGYVLTLSSLLRGRYGAPLVGHGPPRRNQSVSYNEAMRRLAAQNQQPRRRPPPNAPGPPR